MGQADEPPVGFSSAEELDAFWTRNPRAPIWACLLELFAYPSFFEEVVFYRLGGGVRIKVEFRSYAMDLHGDATHVWVVYEVPSLADALDWLHRRLLHTVADCRTGPLPLPGGVRGDGWHDPHGRRFQAAWRRLREDFRKGRLIDRQLPVVERYEGPERCGDPERQDAKRSPHTSRRRGGQHR